MGIEGVVMGWAGGNCPGVKCPRTVMDWEWSWKHGAREDGGRKEVREVV